MRNLLICSFLFISLSSLAKLSPKVKYRTSFHTCPSRSAGTLTLKLIRSFEESGSLKGVKELIHGEKLQDKHFVSSYKIDYDPLRKMLNVNLECPKALMKVQIYKENGIDSYDAILVDNGKLFDPTYEVLLRSEEKIKKDLPFLAIPVGNMDQQIQKEITSIVNGMSESFRERLSEVILNEKKELTIILSVRNNPSSVFLGNDLWDKKVTKLKKIVKYMEAKKKMPAIINLTNSEKVVVKFNGKF